MQYCKLATVAVFMLPNSKYVVIPSQEILPDASIHLAQICPNPHLPHPPPTPLHKRTVKLFAFEKLFLEIFAMFLTLKMLTHFTILVIELKTKQTKKYTERYAGLGTPKAPEAISNGNL